MDTETPRDADGNRLCAWCGSGPVPPSRGTKPRVYCKAGCKTRAWEARRLARQLEEAREAVRQEEAEQRPAKLLNAYLKGRAEEASLGPAKSRDDSGSARAKSRDVPRRPAAKSRDVAEKPQADAAVTPAVPPAAAPGGLPAGPSIRQRRRLFPPPPGVVRADEPADS